MKQLGSRWRGRCRVSSWVLLVLWVPACYAPLDVIGVEETVTEQKSDALRDDDIGDKHPTYDPSYTILENFGECSVELNKSGSVTVLSIGKLAGEDAPLDGKLFATRGAALEALGERTVIPSMEVVNGALKPFNDGLYAAIELAAEDGSDASPVDKGALLRELLASLVDRYETGPASDHEPVGRAATQLAAAVELGGETPEAPTAIAAEATALAERFRANGTDSRPIGLYTWLPELERIFQRDRFLQGNRASGSDIGAFAATALVLDAAPDLADHYRRTLDLYSGLTNPFFDQSPFDLLPYVSDGSLAAMSSIESAFLTDHPSFAPDSPCGTKLAYLPASESPETTLFNRLACDGLLDSDSNLIDILIEAIRAGQVDLTPSETSGWYDRQLYALETLLLPERAAENDHLLLTRSYKEKLVETFKSLITQTRETHVKQLARTMAASAPPPEIDIYPLLPVEPFPTYYLRTARAYAFLSLMLEGVMGEEFLTTARRVLETGERSSQTLREELDERTKLLYGLHVVAARSIGMHDEITDEELPDSSPEEAEAVARAWLEGWRADSDLLRDPRVIVPLTPESYWAVVGVKVLRAKASFYPGYEPEVVGGRCAVRGFVPFEPYLLVEQMIEIHRSGDPMTRDEFRALCDEYDTVDSITEALASGE